MGLFADMRFTMTNTDRSCHPERLLRNARSVVAAVRSYARPEPAKPTDVAPRAASALHPSRRVPAAARATCAGVGEHLQALSPGARFVVHVDSNHHVDREAAARAGIAVYGKNTLAITRRHGSWVVLGALMTDVELAPTARGSGRARRGTHAAPARPVSTPARPMRSSTAACSTPRSCLSYLSQSRLEQLPFAAARSMIACTAATSARRCARGTGARSGVRAHLEPDCRRRRVPAAERVARERRQTHSPSDTSGCTYPTATARYLQRNARVALANAQPAGTARS